VCVVETANAQASDPAAQCCSNVLKLDAFHGSASVCKKADDDSCIIPESDCWFGIASRHPEEPACCSPTCGVCGGEGCNDFPAGGTPGCCVSQLDGGRKCTDNTDVGCDLS